MADSINGLNGYGSSYNFYGRQNKKQAEEEVAQTTVSQDNAKNTQVAPDRVMDILANQYTAPIAPKKEYKADDAMLARMAVFMKNFEDTYKVVAEEVGEAFAPMIMDAMTE